MSTQPTPYPTRAALALEAASQRELERVFQRGTTPNIDELAGWEFRGINRIPTDVVAKLTGIKKFVKGFHRGDDGRVLGYNTPVGKNALDGRWLAQTKRFGFYEVTPVDPTARDNAYLHAVLLDYSKGDNPTFDVTRNLRDYLVQVDPANPDLFLGNASFAVGPARISYVLGYFILERWRRN
jgi:hypothetical protein